VNLLEENKRFLDFLGVTKFHEAGYFGERGLTASGEQWDLNDYNPDGLCIDPYPNEYKNSTHAIETAKVFHQIAPKRKLVQLPSTTNYIGGVYDLKMITHALPVIKEMHIDTMFTASVGSTDVKAMDTALDKTKDYFTYFMSAGNDNAKSYNRYLDCESIFGVGEYYLMYPSNTPSMAYESSVSEYVDFVAPSMISIPSDNGSYTFSGTSCSCPVLAGMCALVNDFFIDKTGKPLSRANMYQFLKDYSIDIYTDGKDTKSGWGAVILPDPKDIDIKKYAEVDITEYKDKSAISSWALSAVENCYNSGIMTGDANGNFNPQKAITREEIAVIINRLLEKEV